MGQILIGISSWADPELIESGFYPSEVKTPEDRLRYYASQFSIVEMDSSYHFLPTRRNLSAWIEATPTGFLFDAKAFSILTRHPAPINSLPRDMREKAASIAGNKKHLYLHNLPADMIDQLWERFSQAILPLFSAGKLGLVTFQFPPWFHPSSENYNFMAECQARLFQYPLAVEFRTGDWLNHEHLEFTLRFLKEKGLALVCVDEPQGLKSSVPPIAELTNSLGIVRFHGRNQENWERQGVAVNEKYNYLYSEKELNEWAPKINALASRAEKVLVIFKNKHCDYAVQNARRMRELLDLPASNQVT